MARILSTKSLLTLICLVCLALLSGQAYALPRSEPHFKAVAFDYFVIFDPNSVVPAAEAEFPGRGAEFVKAWRSKQFEYCFLRSITARHTDFESPTCSTICSAPR
jgi:2-haloacid dehalogenase